jgi:hypothetical protein
MGTERIGEAWPFVPSQTMPASRKRKKMMKSVKSSGDESDERRQEEMDGA